MESSRFPFLFMSKLVNSDVHMWGTRRLSLCPCNWKVAPLKIRVSFQQRYYIKKEKKQTNKQAFKCQSLRKKILFLWPEVNSTEIGKISVSKMENSLDNKTYYIDGK